MKAEFIEASEFTAEFRQFLTDEDYAELGSSGNFVAAR